MKNIHPKYEEFFIKHKNIVIYLHGKHPNFDDLKNAFLNTKTKESLSIEAIKKFSGFEYDKQHKAFSKKLGNQMFITEKVSLEDINTPVDLCRAVEQLNDGYEKRQNMLQKNNQEHIPHDILPPQEVAEISRDNVNEYLQAHHGIDEQGLFKKDEHTKKKIMYDLYRNFTGHVPLKNTNKIGYHLPDHPDITITYGDQPRFEKISSPFELVREMRKLKKNTEQSLKEVPIKRIEELKKLAKKNIQNQDIER